MPLNVGDPAPPITGTNFVGLQPWSLEDHGGKMMLLVFSSLTDIPNVCASCRAEAPALQAVWQELQGSSFFTMAIIAGKLGGATEAGTALSNAIDEFGITFPVVPAEDSWPQYAITNVPTKYCLRWDPANTQYRVCGVLQGGESQKQDILDFLDDCLIDRPDWPWAHELGHWKAVFTHLFGGVISGGGGWGITPGGKPIPIPPPSPLRYLGPAGRDALMGLAIAEMAGHFRDSELRKRVREAGIGAAKAAILRLAGQRARWAQGEVSMEPSAQGPNRIPTPEKPG